jgi:hypothetical protein
MSNKSQMHELLAVETSLEQQAVKIMEETIKGFTRDHHLYKGQCRVVMPYDENQEQFTDQLQEVTTTVDNRLNYTKDFVTRHYDAAFQKELTNQEAKADLIVNGTILAENVPVTFLLGLEKKLKRLRTVYSSIPTRAPGIAWVQDPEKEDGIFKTKEPIISFQEKKIPKGIVMYEATKEHPAQVQIVNETVQTAKYEKTEWTSMISSAKKSKLLGNIDTLLKAVSKARARANKQEVIKRKIGKEIFDFINS